MRNSFYNIAYITLILVFLYVSIITGTFVHELLHVEDMDKPILLQVNFDGSGFTKGEIYKEVTTYYSHKMIYLVDYATSFITFMILLFLLIIVKDFKEDDYG